jgi:hypothetical protein
MPTWRVDKTRPIGKHTLGNVMTKLSEMCNFDEPDDGGKQTNAAGRHLCITRCASEGVAQREINMHVRNSTAGISMQYQEVTLQTETMRLKALMPDEKKVNEIILERQLKYGNLPPPKAMSFPNVSNVSVPISTKSNKRTQTQKKRVPFAREPLKQLAQNENEMYVNSNGRQGVFRSVNSNAPRQGVNSIHRQNNNQLNCNSDRNKNKYEFATQKTRKYGD